jgi:hypothetical protein
VRILYALDIEKVRTRQGWKKRVFEKLKAYFLGFDAFGIIVAIMFRRGYADCNSNP